MGFISECLTQWLLGVLSFYIKLEGIFTKRDFLKIIASGNNPLKFISMDFLISNNSNVDDIFENIFIFSFFLCASLISIDLFNGGVLFYVCS